MEKRIDQAHSASWYTQHCVAVCFKSHNGHSHQDAKAPSLSRSAGKLSCTRALPTRGSSIPTLERSTLGRTTARGREGQDVVVQGGPRSAQNAVLCQERAHPFAVPSRYLCGKWPNLRRTQISHVERTATRSTPVRAVWLCALELTNTCRSTSSDICRCCSYLNRFQRDAVPCMRRRLATMSEAVSKVGHVHNHCTCVSGGVNLATGGLQARASTAVIKTISGKT